MKHHSKAAPVWLHGARLLFPLAATLLFLVLTEWIARGTLNADTFLQYIFPHAEAYLLAWGLLFLVWLALCSAGNAAVSPAGLSARYGGFLHPSAAG